MKGRSSFTHFKLWASLIIIFIALGLTFISCKPAKQAEEETTAPAPAVTEEAPAATSDKTTFKWIPLRPGVTVAQVGTGRAVVCPFEFTVNDPSITKVTLSIRDDKIAQMGVVIAEAEVDVADGKVASEAMFGVPPGTRLGNYELAIVAKNAETGEVIGEGIIPFQIVPPGIGGC